MESTLFYRHRRNQATDQSISAIESIAVPHFAFNEHVVHVQSPKSGRHRQGKVSEAPSDVLAATGVPIAGIMSLPLLMNLFCLPVQAAAAAAYHRKPRFPLHPPPYPNFHYNQMCDFY